MMKNPNRWLTRACVAFLLFCGVLFAFGAMEHAEAAPSPVSLVATSDVPSTDGTRCDATFIGSGLASGQLVNLEFEGFAKTNKGGSIELTADANGQVTQTVNTVGTPMVGNGTYWVKLTSGPNKVLTKMKVTFSCA